MKNALKSILKLCGRNYYRFRATPFIRDYINHEGRSRFNVEPVSLSTVQKRILAAIQTDGIGIAHVEELFPQGVFQQLYAYAHRRWNDHDVFEKRNRRGEAIKEGKLLSKDYFLANLWEGDYVLDLEHPFIKFSIGQPILDVVNAYLGLWAKFRDFRLQATMPMPEGDRRYASQEWHRDPEDQKLVKVFLYLNDVEKDAGPFTYVRQSHSEGKWKDLFPQRIPAGSACDSATIEKLVPSKDIVVATGRAGTIIFCDTSGIHRGGFAKSHERFMYTSVFTTSASVWPIRYRYPDNFKNSLVYPPSQYAVENDPSQKEPKWY